MEALKLLNKCLSCGNEIEGKNANGSVKKYCSRQCYHNLKKLERKETNLSRRLGLKSGETGQINEMLVTINLIKRGYKVFVPFDTTCSFDLLAYKEGNYKKVQVKTGTYNYNNSKLPVVLKNSDYDILAVVYQLSDIDYNIEV